MYPIYSEDNVPDCCKSCDNLRTGVEEYQSGESADKWWCKWNIIMPVVKHECRRHKPKEESENDRLKRLFS
jgi:hypothetical protein